MFTHIIQRHSMAVLPGSCRPPPRPNTSEAQLGETIVLGVLKTIAKALDILHLMFNIRFVRLA